MHGLYHFAFRAMGSPCSIQFHAESRQHAESVYQIVTDRIIVLEQRYSRYRKDSLVSEINNRAGTGIKTPLDQETVALLRYADQCFQESQQLFDITSGVLRRLWNSKITELPSTQQIKSMLPLIGWKKVEWDEKSISLPIRGMELDFGGIVKEYAADSVATLCLNNGISQGIIELGGDIKVIGPPQDSEGWPVSIRDPRQPDRPIVQLKMASGALATSGDYERFQLINGIRYSHLLNPNTGWPVAGLQAVSVIAEHCVVAGSLATIAMLKADKGLKWLRSCQLPFLCGKSNGQIINQLQLAR